jgi:hypothetical protein
MLQKICRSQKSLYVRNPVFYWISGIIYQIFCVGYQVMVAVSAPQFVFVYSTSPKMITGLGVYFTRPNLAGFWPGTDRLFL